MMGQPTRQKSHKFFKCEEDSVISPNFLVSILMDSLISLSGKFTDEMLE